MTTHTTPPPPSDLRETPTDDLVRRLGDTNTRLLEVFSTGVAIHAELLRRGVKPDLQSAQDGGH